MLIQRFKPVTVRASCIQFWNHKIWGKRLLQRRVSCLVFKSLKKIPKEVLSKLLCFWKQSTVCELSYDLVLHTTPNKTARGTKKFNTPYIVHSEEHCKHFKRLYSYVGKVFGFGMKFSVKVVLYEQESVNFFCKGPDRRYYGVWGHTVLSQLLNFAIVAAIDNL